MKKRLLQAINNKKGSAIIWAMAVAMVLLIILGGVLTISKAYASRSVYNNSEQQAYVTARSAVNMITNEFVNHTDKAYEMYNYINAIPGTYPKTWSVSDVGFADEMGDCSLQITLTAAKSITVTATSPSEKGDMTVVANMQGAAKPKINGVTVPMIYDPVTNKPKLQWVIVTYDN